MVNEVNITIKRLSIVLLETLETLVQYGIFSKDTERVILAFYETRSTTKNLSIRHIQYDISKDTL